ncbi:putative cupredoxin-like copper-binding protein [Glaciihabitans sp. UYNi722]
MDVTFTDVGGPMMGGDSGPMSGGAMRLTADRATVRHGTVSFLVTNGGSVTHELLVLPLPESQIAGTQPFGGDGKIDEAGSLGEASTTCGEGAGQGILPGTSGWVSVTLVPGRYELVCNLPGHYAAGMYTQLTVTGHSDEAISTSGPLTHFAPTMRVLDWFHQMRSPFPLRAPSRSKITLKSVSTSTVKCRPLIVRVSPVVGLTLIRKLYGAVSISASRAFRSSDEIVKSMSAFWVMRSGVIVFGSGRMFFSSR